MEEIQPGIYRQDGELYTRNSCPGYSHYGEELVEVEGEEYRLWNPQRSKPAAAVEKGLELGIGPGDEVLYLGAASGTTVSHFSDMAVDGFVVAVEKSADSGRRLVRLAEQRQNVAPVIANARNPESYSEFVREPDLVYQDVAQRDQAEILLKNAERFEVDNAVIAVKAGSVSSSESPEAVMEDVKESLLRRFELIDETKLEPYHGKHLFLKLRS